MEIEKKTEKKAGKKITKATAKMDLTQILACMRSWKTCCGDASKLNGYFGLKNYFIFDCYDSHKGYPMHIYPGVDAAGKIYYFVISAFYDKLEYRDRLADYIQPCELLTPTANEEITPKEAKERIELWKKLRKTWLEDQVVMSDGIYKAFYVPVEDVDRLAPKNTSFLALSKGENPNKTGYSADMVIKENLLYFDTVRPVPPFKPTIIEASFYLLSQV